MFLILLGHMGEFIADWAADYCGKFFDKLDEIDDE